MAFFTKMHPSIGANKKQVGNKINKLFIQDENKNTEQIIRILDDINKIPEGKYITNSELSIGNNNSEFAVILLPTSEYLILATQNYTGSCHEISGIRAKISRKYGKESKCKFVNATHEIIRTLRNQSDCTECITDWGENSEVEQIAREIIESAIKQGASDIHLETRRPRATMFFRINGQRIEQPSVSYKTAMAIGNVLYTFHADSSSKDIQWFVDRRMDTSISYVSESNTPVQLRFSSVPIFPVGNISIVIRILKMVSIQNEKEFSLEKLGYSLEHSKDIIDMLVGVQGLVLLVGPTNSGKSTSMRTFVRTIQNRPENTNVKILTVEDPVEYVISDACQIGVSREREDLKNGGSVFQGFLKATLRQDPDVVIIGEIRDEETASVVKDLVLSGRKIISTLHAFSSFAAFPRLKEIGVPSSVLYMDNFISGVIYQRLVPVICPYCKIPVLEAREQGMVDSRLFERLARVIDLTNETVFIKNRIGCEQCKGTGIIGRTVCAEVIVPDKKILELLKAERFTEAEKYWRNFETENEFGRSAMAHAIMKMKAGLLDPHHVESQVGILRVTREITESIPMAPYSYQKEDQGPLINTSLYS